MGSLAALGRYLGRYLSSGQETGNWLAETLKQRDGMDFSFAVTSLFLLVAGAIWLRGARYLERDTAMAPYRISKQGNA
jgi:hypothetical protein